MIIASIHNDYSEVRITYSQEDELMQMLENSSYDERYYREFREEIEAGMDVDRYEEVYFLMLHNQLDIISSGKNYQMKDIVRKINNEI